MLHHFFAPIPDYFNQLSLQFHSPFADQTRVKGCLRIIILFVGLTAPLATVAGPRLPLVLNPDCTYLVKSDGESLSRIAIQLYGKMQEWKSIAKINGLSDPNFIRIGDRLRLHKLPTLSPEEGQRRLAEYKLQAKKSRPKQAYQGKGKKDFIKIDEEFMEKGRPFVDQKKLEKAFEYFSPLTHAPLLSKPTDENLVFLEGAPAERIYRGLRNPTRRPASAFTFTMQNKRAPERFNYDQFEHKSGADIVCAKVPLVDVNREYVFSKTGLPVFNYRCVGIKK